jgi:2-hydroxy-3-keto-5-methylthiopentenyl-1-phosphate phosphatase
MNPNNPTNPTYERIVFCDFDGTVTAVETFVAMLKRFATANYSGVESQLTRREITLGQGVRRLVESIPSARFADMQAYIRRQAIRPGFEALLDFLEARRIPLVVISGGLREQVETRLEAYRHRIHQVHAATIDTDSEYIRLTSEYENSFELVSKKTVMATYAYRESVAIGDGITDISMSVAADIVFARDNLCRYLDRSGRSYHRWQTFFDIRDALAERWL